MSEPLAAGIHALAVPGLAGGFAGGFAAVFGAHRFLHNDNVTLPHLVEPLHQLARQWRQQAPDAWGLVVHDWSALKYPGHARKADQTRLTNRRSRGYELTTLLLVDGRHGDPIAPLEVRLRAARKVYSTRQPAPRRMRAAATRCCRPWRPSPTRTWAARWCMSSTAKPTRWRRTATGRPPAGTSWSEPKTAARCAGRAKNNPWPR